MHICVCLCERTTISPFQNVTASYFRMSLKMNMSNGKQTSMLQLSGIIFLCRQPMKFYYDDEAEKLMTGQVSRPKEFYFIEKKLDILHSIRCHMTCSESQQMDEFMVN